MSDQSLFKFDAHSIVGYVSPKLLELNIFINELEDYWYKQFIGNTYYGFDFKRFRITKEYIYNVTDAKDSKNCKCSEYSLGTCWWFRNISSNAKSIRRKADSLLLCNTKDTWLTEDDASLVLNFSKRVEDVKMQFEEWKKSEGAW